MIYKRKLAILCPESRDCGGFFDFDSKKSELETARQKTTASDFWADPGQAQPILQRIRRLEIEIDEFEALVRQQNEMIDFADLATEEQDESILPELEKMIA